MCVAAGGVAEVKPEEFALELGSLINAALGLLCELEPIVCCEAVGVTLSTSLLQMRDMIVALAMSAAAARRVDVVARANERRGMGVVGCQMRARCVPYVLRLGVGTPGSFWAHKICL